MSVRRPLSAVGRRRVLVLLLVRSRDHEHKWDGPSLIQRPRPSTSRLLWTRIVTAAAPSSTSTWTRKGGGGASGIEHGRLRRRALPDFQQPLRLEQGARALAVATTQPRAKMAWQVKIRNAPTPTPWGNEYRWQAQQTFHQQSRLGCMDRQVICLGFRLLYKRLYKPPCEERSQAWLTCFVPQPSTRTTQDHLQSPVS
ncbi:hypothetical protein HPB47_009743 [Ixodes persulcatus]|uniref:Uncharacterized protein n=1 Tax=Ixodes persulcatus TaxID=34615 RepID=A0AC60P0Z5_IXOPE|nr:hypothetical protein HPB47_009743 [Ixodes persulcatus]